MSLEEGMAVALTELANTPESEFTKEIVEKFVLETVEQSAPAETSLGFQSYPYNHLNYLARVSSTWAQEQQCPLTFQPIPLLVECSDLQQSIQAHSGAVCDSIAKFDTTKDHSHLLSLFVCLGLSGVRTLLGIRHVWQNPPPFLSFTPRPDSRKCNERAATKSYGDGGRVSAAPLWNEGLDPHGWSPRAGQALPPFAQRMVGRLSGS
eukprot:c18382_g1_i3.p1 GENE.c18382_g1_i3~~c18382_g1_i3.p1  ORF type:complete len:220 (-),score=27.32 c18382_g1_i3:446-1066(-)